MNDLTQVAPAAPYAPSKLLCRGWLLGIEDADHHGMCTLRVRDANMERRVIVPESSVEGRALPLQSIVIVRGDDEFGTEVEVVHRARPLPVDIEAGDLADLEHRHLHIRSPRLRAAAQFRHFVNKYAREFLDEQGFFCAQTPILTEASCVCSGDVFTFPYYGKKIATLIQSPWMYADALVSSVERVYTLNPSFRREREATGIHLVEIWQLQVDMAWADNAEVMEMEESLVRHIATRLRDNHQDLYALGGLSSTHLDAVMEPFLRMSYVESVDLLNRLGFDFKHGQDYTQEHNDAMGSHLGCPHFITDYPQSLKNFWFPVDGESGLTPSNDLFAHTGQGELIGGGERVTDADMLIENLEYFGHDTDEFAWFVDVRRHGCVPHAGFSIGFDRLVAFMMGSADIRGAVMFPRIPRGPIKP